MTMMNKNQQHNLYGLYALADSSLISGDELASAVEEVILGGAQLIQYRDKSQDHQKRRREAEALRYICHRHSVPLIINDDVALAQRIHADGVHLGKDDISISEARQKLGSDAIIGASSYNSLSLARTAQRLGADYVAFGSFFSSETKPNAVKADLHLLREAKQTLSIPVCGIGGISSKNAAQLIEENIDMVAVISGIFKKPDFQQAAYKITQLFTKFD